MLQKYLYKSYFLWFSQTDLVIGFNKIHVSSNQVWNSINIFNMNIILFI